MAVPVQEQEMMDPEAGVRRPQKIAAAPGTALEAGPQRPQEGIAALGTVLEAGPQRPREGTAVLEAGPQRLQEGMAALEAGTQRFLAAILVLGMEMLRLREEAAVEPEMAAIPGRAAMGAATITQISGAQTLIGPIRKAGLEAIPEPAAAAKSLGRRLGSPRK